MIKIGILGFAHGRSGSYAAAMRASPHTSLSGIADSELSRGRKAAEEFSAPFFESAEALLASEIDAVLILAENSLRHKLALEAAAAGKHVLCEMPMAASLQDAEAMVRACREKNRILAAALPFRHSTPILRAREIVTSGKLGNIVAFKIIHHARRPRGPQGWLLDKQRSGGGAVLNLAVHAADLVRWFVGSDVREVYAEIGNSSVDNDIDDCGVLTLTLENDVFGTIETSWLYPPKSYPAEAGLVVEITGTEGFLSVDALGQKIVSFSEKVGRGQDVCWGDDMYLALVNDFGEAVSRNLSPAATAEDGLLALKVALAAYRSAEEKQPAHL